MYREIAGTEEQVRAIPGVRDRRVRATKVRLYNSVAVLLGVNEFSYTQRYSISFPFFSHTFCPYLESLTSFHEKYLIVQASYVHLNG